MLRVVARIGNIGKLEEEWDEEIVVTDKESAYSEIRSIIKNFNQTIRMPECEQKRALRGKLKISKNQRFEPQHTWEKQNLVTTERMTDIWKCKNCKKRAETHMGPPSVMGCKGVKKRLNRELR